jgi:hypothetical protein
VDYGILGDRPLMTVSPKNRRPGCRDSTLLIAAFIADRHTQIEAVAPPCASQSAHPTTHPPYMNISGKTTKNLQPNSKKYGTDGILDRI